MGLFVARRSSFVVREKIPLIVLAVFLFASASLVFAETTSKDDVPAYGDAIVVASISDARTLVPILASDSASSDICGIVFNGLVKYDKDIKIIPDLTENWEILDSGLTILFRLKKNVKWHDGRPFTARDVEFTYRKLVDPSVKTPYSGDFERIAKLEVVDDYTVKISYKEPFAPALASWGMWIMPEHLLKNEDLNKTSFARHPVGTGPYKFKSWKTAEKIELVSNHDYFEGRPYIDRYIYRIIPDESTIFLELQTKCVDMSGLTPLQYTRQTDNKFFRAHYNKLQYPSFGYTYLGYNLSDPKFADVRVRQAIDRAVDKEAIIDTIFFGLARVITGPYMIDSWAYDKNIKPQSRDIEKARKLLEDAGWAAPDGDGWLKKNGARFEFTTIVNQGNSERLRCAEMIQANLADVGIKMKIRVIEWSAMINEFIDKKHFEAVLMGWVLSRDPDNFDIWHSSKTREGEFNFLGYKNTEVDALLIEGRRQFDQSKRAEIYHRIHKIIFEDQPCLFLYSAEVLPIVSSRFRGIEPSPIGIGYNFIKWYAPKSEQRYR